MTKTSKKTNKNKGEDGLLRVGELAKSVGKTVRAIHLYEELGLVRPERRTEGGFRLYAPDAIARIGWIIKLQAVGFTLSEVQGFVSQFEASASGREATRHVREVFARKRQEVREQITQLQVIDNDIEEALDYLDACTCCSTTVAPVECNDCDHHGHEGEAPQLFAVLSRTAATTAKQYDVDAENLRPGSRSTKITRH